MRQVFTICAIFIQLLGYFSAEAKSAALLKTETRQESPETFSAFFQHDHPANITYSGHHLKVRYQRTSPDLIDLSSAPDLVYSRSGKRVDGYVSPLYLPLIRLLLYPNHYFW